MSTLREAAEEALRWMEHARLHLTIKERMHPDGLGLYDNAAEALRSALAKPDTEPVVIGPEWTPCVKLPITVHVREQRPDEQHVSTREGITPVKPDDLIMRGVAGEEYPIGRELFEKTYRIGAHLPRDEWRPASDPPEESAAHAMGASGSPVVEGERLAFEAWMRGHCWELRATWTGDQYIGTDEGDVKSMATKWMLDADAMRTRMMWAAWRDRGALARMSDIEPPEQEQSIGAEIKAARDEVAQWPQWMQEAARRSAVAVEPPEQEGTA